MKVDIACNAALSTDTNFIDCEYPFALIWRFLTFGFDPTHAWLAV
jgi:hypothetical protein